MLTHYTPAKSDTREKEIICRKCDMCSHLRHYMQIIQHILQQLVYIYIEHEQ